jgi:general secretion pathway protein J
MSRAQKGFTLIELLVALAIFAILSLLSYRTLGSLFETREQLNIESAKWRDAALFFSRVENDLAMAAVPRHFAWQVLQLMMQR